MDSLRLPYQAGAPGVDEDVPAGTSATDAVMLLSRRKAEAVADRFPGALVIGADQLVSSGGQVLGKPTHRDGARAQLRTLLGKSHDICTGLCVIAPGQTVHQLDVARVTLFSLSDEELERYLDLGEWEGCAGAYRVEGAGRALFAGLEGDMTSVQGLPLLRLVRILRDLGVPFFA